MVDLVIMGDVVRENKRNFLQFVFFFFFGLLQQGCPLTNVETIKLLFKFLKVKNTPKKQLNDIMLDGRL